MEDRCKAVGNFRSPCPIFRRFAPDKMGPVYHAGCGLGPALLDPPKGSWLMATYSRWREITFQPILFFSI